MLLLFLNLSSSGAAAAPHISLKRVSGKSPSFINPTGILSELAGPRNALAGAFIIDHDLTVSHISVPGRVLLHTHVFYI